MAEITPDSDRHAVPQSSGYTKDPQAENATTLRETLALAWRCWPYYRPQAKHLATFVLVNSILGAMVLGVAVLGADLVENKVLLGEKLEPLQASLLVLGDEFVSGAEADEAPLSTAQRVQLRQRIIYAGAVLALLLLSISVVVWYYQTWIFQRVNQQLRVEMLARVEHLSLRYHSGSRTGDAIYRVYQDSATIVNVLLYMILSPLRVLAWAGFGLAVLLLFAPLLGLLIVAAAVPTALLMRHYIPKVRVAATLSRERNSDLTSRIQETLAAIRVVKASGAEQRLMERFDEDSQGALDAAFEMRKNMAFLTVGVAVVGLTCVFIADYFMATWAMREVPTYFGGSIALVGFAVWNLGAFKAATSRAEDASQQVWELAFYWCTVQDLVAGLRRAFFLLDLEPEVVDVANPQAFPAALQSVRLDNIHFAYEAARPVLQGASLSANASTVTAIVGSTGSGKSTLMSLLLRLYNPDSGGVFVNDLALSQISTHAVRANVAIALQQNVLFAMSVADNIRYGMADVDEAQVIAAAKVACADEFIQAMPQGYATELGERGGKLSTGQRQRISIARAILRDTPILILDEPTAALDAETERQVMKNLAAWGQSRVIFIITHRLSTVRNADQIAFLEDGVVKELGSHTELLAQDGAYAGFVAAEQGDLQTAAQNRD
ncbi:MAG: ATP-binding cassette domain-containing protein [Proteobacteria bacterium]|nr:ATP-binding cassette domain-containing protein [Pseudomonadota bacterium]